MIQMTWAVGATGLRDEELGLGDEGKAQFPRKKKPEMKFIKSF